MGRRLVSVDGLIKKFIVSGITGILITLFLTIILKLILADTAILFMPLWAGLLTTYFSKELNFFKGSVLGLLASIVTLIWIPPHFILLGIVGGFIGTLLNIYICNSPKFSTSTGSDGPNKRIQVIPTILEHKIPNKKIRYGLILIIIILLVWGVSYGINTEKTVENNNNVVNTNATINDDAEIKNITEQLKSQLSVFYGNLNVLFAANGVDRGYILNSINITEVQKLSKKKIRVTLNIRRVTNDGANYTSIWEGPFYLENGTWIDKGDFVQIHCYNATGFDVLHAK